MARGGRTGLDHDVEAEVSCCFALQDKTWLRGPDNAWEVYTVLDDAPSMGCDTSPATCCAGGPAPDQAAAGRAT